MCARRKYCNIEKETNMTKKKKIGLLNLPVDNNFGGHLQRYALMEVMRSDSIDVIHLNCRPLNSRKSIYKLVKFFIIELIRFIKGLLKRKYSLYDVLYLKYLLRGDPKTERFYETYVKHTGRIYTKKELASYLDFDSYLVGSDQVWRAKMANYQYGIDTYFFDYLPNTKSRYAYGVSLGTQNGEYTDEEIMRLSSMYRAFKMVSVREEQSIDTFQQCGWNEPAAIPVLDPTMLLDKEHYSNLVTKVYTKKSSGNMFCYVLDENEDKQLKIEQIAKDKHLIPFYISLKTNCSIEQWLRSFMDAEFVVTDSYHGLVFSLIFNKPFYLLYNNQRGNARFESLLNRFCIKGDERVYNWNIINTLMQKEREKSLEYIKNMCESL